MLIWSKKKNTNMKEFAIRATFKSTKWTKFILRILQELFNYQQWGTKWILCDFSDSLVAEAI